MSRAYVGNLSWGTTWQDLKDHMRDEANLDVVHVKVLQDRQGRSKGCGIVEFSDPDAAAIAIEKLTDTELDGRKIFVREDREPVSDRDGGNRGGGNRGGRPPPQSSERADYDRGEKNESIEPGSQLFVGNLSWETGWQDLKDHFNQCGDVIRSDVAEGRDGRKKGFGFIRYATAEDASKAIEELNGVEFMGRPLEVRLDGGGRPPRQSSKRADYDRGENNESIEPGSQLFVGNLSWETGWQDLKDHFNQCGDVIRSDVAEGRDGRKKGFGFIRYATAEDASKAIEELNGVEFMGRDLEVRLDLKA